MPRPIVMGNGELFLGFDERGNAREFTWPQVGYPNHLVDGWVKWGVHVDNSFSWLDSDEWTRQFEVVSAMVGSQTKLYCERLRLGIRFQDWLEAGGTWRRRAEVVNRGSERREIRVFQSQLFNIDESVIGNTAFYDPVLEGVKHYKNGRWISVCANGYDGLEYACGFADWGEFEGTWRDAEDGELSGKPIEQGKVDSTLGWMKLLAPGEVWSLDICVRAGHDEELVSSPVPWEDMTLKAHDRYFDDEEDLEFGGEIDELISQSKRIVRAHTDSSGAVIAAGDSEILRTARASYASVWFRDSALIADSVADPRFWDFFLACVGDSNFAHQKYSVRGDVASGWLPRVRNGQPVLPIQQDECALPIWYGLKHELPGGRDTSERFLDLMLEYRTPDGLPKPSWDLWEERWGVHLWTVVTVIEALRQGGRADLPRSNEYASAAEVMLMTMREKFWNDRYECVARALVEDGAGGYQQDLTPDSSMLAAMLFESSGQLHDWLPGMIDRAKRELKVDSSVGGFARYPGDYYFRMNERYPGNPWVICTLWVARAEMAIASSVSELDQLLKEAMTWCVDRAYSTYVLAEQFHPDTGQPLSVAPLTWSHAEVLETFTFWRLRRRELS